MLCAIGWAGMHAFAAPASPPKGAAKVSAGAILSHEEGPGSRILYNDAKGGVLVPVAPPVLGSARDPMPAPDATQRPRAPGKRIEYPVARKGGS